MNPSKQPRKNPVRNNSPRLPEFDEKTLKLMHGLGIKVSNLIRSDPLKLQNMINVKAIPKNSRDPNFYDNDIKKDINVEFAKHVQNFMDLNENLENPYVVVLDHIRLGTTKELLKIPNLKVYIIEYDYDIYKQMKNSDTYKENKSRIRIKYSCIYDYMKRIPEYSNNSSDYELDKILEENSIENSNKTLVGVHLDFKTPPLESVNAKDSSILLKYLLRNFNIVVGYTYSRRSGRESVFREDLDNIVNSIVNKYSFEISYEKYYKNMKLIILKK